MDAHGPNIKSASDPSQIPLLPPLSYPPNHDGLSGSIKRRRPSGTGSRGVANLTPDQLAKKRANDREAQRAIRERTRSQIESLERKIQELTAQQPYQDLQHVIRQKELVEAENEEIKKRLNSAIGILQPILNSHIIPDLAQPLCRDAPGTQPSFSPRPDGPMPLHSIMGGPVPQYPEALSLRSGTSTSSTFTASPQGPRLSPLHQPITTYPPAGNLFSNLDPCDGGKINVARGLDLPPSSDRLNLGFLLDNRHHVADGRGKCDTGRGGPPVSTYSAMGGISSASHAVQGGVKVCERFEAPMIAHATPVRNIGPTCPLDGLLLDFLAERRQRAAEGMSSQKLVGPTYPSVSSLLNPERSIYTHPLSKFFTDILSTFPDLSALPEQVAVLYIMFLIMRWQIHPTQEAYDRLPDWVTPRPSQLFTPHPAWVDHLPWPRMRDKMVQLYPSIALENFFVPYTTTLSLNWPYDPSDTLLSVPESDELSINPVFERHMRDLANWTLGPAFAKSFPMLADTCKIKPDPTGRTTS